MTKASLAAVLILLAAAPLRARQGPRPPNAEALLARALAGPATGYSAVERVQWFPPGRGKAKGLRVAVLAGLGGRTRREAAARGGPAAAYGRDGKEAFLFLPKKERLWRGPYLEETPEAALERLRAFYEISASTGGRVAKRRTWRVDLAAGGVRRRALWLDRETGIVLKRETYRPDGRLARRERVVSLEIPIEVSAESFRAPEAAWTLPWTALAKGSDAAAWERLLPRWLPDGFVLVDARPAAAGRDGAFSASYSDGAAAFTLSRHPDRAPDWAPGRRVVSRGGRSYSVDEVGGGLAVAARVGGAAVVAAGDLIEDELARVLDSLPGWEAP